MPEPTKEEARWIARLRRVVKDMPPRLVLFASGDLNVMRATDAGCVPFTKAPYGGADPTKIIAIVGRCEGGDW